MAGTSRDNGPASPAGSGATVPDAAAPGVARRRMPPVWVLFILLGAVNVAVSRLLLPAPTSIASPSSVLKAQVEAGNVGVVTSAGDGITGRFRTAVTYPHGPT